MRVRRSCLKPALRCCLGFGLLGLALLQLPAVPVTAQIPDVGGSLGDKVTVEGRAEVKQAGHKIMAIGFSGWVFTGQTGSRGEFLLEGIPPGTYSIIASSPGFLSASCGPVTHNGGNTVLNDDILLAGDLDGSGAIDMVDVVSLG